MATDNCNVVATKDMCFHCFRELEVSFAGQENQPYDAHASCPLFVTWNKKEYDRWVLRGCIGNFSELHLPTALGQYARIAAFEDSRFSPISQHELPHLQCAVSILTQFETCNDPFDWQPGVHGVRMRYTHAADGSTYSATYLPEVCAEQGWSHEECLTSLLRKGGFRGKVSDRVFSSMTVVRYQSSKVKASFSEYKEWSLSESGSNGERMVLRPFGDLSGL